MPYYLAIDAGGTSTRCVIADSDCVLGRASTGSVKLMRVPEPEATSRLCAMLDEVSASAGVRLDRITRTCFGLAGVAIPAVRAWATAAVGAQVSGSLVVCGDEEIALDAAFRGGPGILVVAGTGSNVIGRTASGDLVGAGGWGPILGDEGSGYWIGLEALRAALRAQDAASIRLSPGDTSAGLLDEIQRAWKVDSLAELIEIGNHRGDATRRAPDFASLAPVVALRAERGNTLAAEILQRAGEDLAGFVALVVGKTSSWPKPIPVAFTGSILSRIKVVRMAMIARLATTVASARVQVAAIDPLDGALWRARNG